VNACEVKADIGVIAGKLPECLACTTKRALYKYTSLPLINTSFHENTMGDFKFR